MSILVPFSNRILHHEVVKTIEYSFVILSCFLVAVDVNVPIVVDHTKPPYLPSMNKLLRLTSVNIKLLVFYVPIMILLPCLSEHTLPQLVYGFVLSVMKLVLLSDLIPPSGECNLIHSFQILLHHFDLLLGLN